MRHTSDNLTSAQRCSIGQYQRKGFVVMGIDQRDGQVMMSQNHCGSIRNIYIDGDGTVHDKENDHG